MNLFLQKPSRFIKYIIPDMADHGTKLTVLFSGDILNQPDFDSHVPAQPIGRNNSPRNGFSIRRRVVLSGHQVDHHLAERFLHYLANRNPTQPLEDTIKTHHPAAIWQVKNIFLSADQLLEHREISPPAGARPASPSSEVSGAVADENLVHVGETRGHNLTDFSRNGGGAVIPENLNEPEILVHMQAAIFALGGQGTVFHAPVFLKCLGLKHAFDHFAHVRQQGFAGGDNGARMVNRELKVGDQGPKIIERGREAGKGYRAKSIERRHVIGNIFEGDVVGRKIELLFPDVVTPEGRSPHGRVGDHASGQNSAGLAIVHAGPEERSRCPGGNVVLMNRTVPVNTQRSSGGSTGLKTFRRAPGGMAGEQHLGICAQGSFFKSRQMRKVIQSEPLDPLFGESVPTKRFAIIGHFEVGPADLRAQLSFNVVMKAPGRVGFPFLVFAGEPFKIGAQPAARPIPAKGIDTQLLQPHRTGPVEVVSEFFLHGLCTPHQKSGGNWWNSNLLLHSPAWNTTKPSYSSIDINLKGKGEYCV